MFFRRKDDTLRLPEKFSNSVVHPVTNGYYTVNLGHNIVVDPGWNAVVVVKEKPRDIIPSGCFELSLPNLPNTTNLLKLNQGKIKKKARDVSLALPQSFKCDLDFVNTNQIVDFPWKSGRVPIKSKLYGRYKASLFGTLSFRVFDSKKFLSLLLLEHGHIKSGQGEKFLSELLNEEIFDSLLFSNFFNPKQFADNEMISKFLIEKLNENFDRFGLLIENLDTKDVRFFGKVNEQLAKEDEANHEFLAEKLDADMILNEGKVVLEEKVPKQKKLKFEQPKEEQLFKTDEQEFDQESQRQVQTLVKVKKNITKRDLQNEINQTLQNSSRMDLSDNSITKIKLNKNEEEN